MQTSRDNNIAILASMLVLFSTMLDARITIVLSFIILVTLITCKLVELREHQPNHERDN